MLYRNQYDVLLTNIDKKSDKEIQKQLKYIVMIHRFPIPSKYFTCMSSALLTFTVAAKYD